VNETVRSYARLQPLVADDLVRIEGPVVTATDTGRSVVRVIASAFEPYTRRCGALQQGCVTMQFA